MSTPTLGPGWIAQVQGDSFDLAYWEQSLKPPFDPVCERIPHGDSTVWGLRSKTFDQLQSAEEIRDEAIVLIAWLNGALSAQCGAEPLTLQGVARIDNCGNFHFFVFAEAHARARSMMPRRRRCATRTGTSFRHRPRRHPRLKGGFRSPNTATMLPICSFSQGERTIGLTSTRRWSLPNCLRVGDPAGN